MINWLSKETHLLLNPRMPEKDQQIFQNILQLDFPGHIWLCTSGSVQLKLVGLSKEAFLTSARAANAHLSCNSFDIWLNPLPHFHVGGLGMMVRAHESGAKILHFQSKWCATDFHQQLCACNCTLTALVPTQIFDLVQNQLQAPSHLRAVIVGGGSLSCEILIKARKLGWNLLPSYGMTECASQIATAKLDDPCLHILPHVNVFENDQGLLCLQSKSLLTAYGIVKEGKLSIEDPKKEGIFTTEDYGFVKNGKIELLGRACDFIKIGGENVNIMRLSHSLEAIKLKKQFQFDLALVPISDERLGTVIHLATESDNTEQISSLVETFQQSVMPFEKIRKVHYGISIPRSPLGKLNKNELIKLLS